MESDGHRSVRALASQETEPGSPRPSGGTSSPGSRAPRLITSPHSTLLTLAQPSFLLAEPLFPEYPRRRTESLEHIQGVPDGRHESLLEPGHEDPIGDPIGSIGG